MSDAPRAGGRAAWPRLGGGDWEATRDTLQMWTQVVGKVRMALEPMINQWWQVTLYVSARGLTTGLMHAGGIGLEIEFDFVGRALVVRTTDGGERRIALEPQTVAEFYEKTMGTLRDAGVPVHILARPVEVVEAIPFTEDVEHRCYDGESVHAFWLALVQADRVFKLFRSRFTGKVSPVHFFWGGFDLAVTRFSGRPAPLHPGGIPNCADWVMQLAYSHEVSSCGFWPGGSPEGSFYSYAYPTPAGFDEQSVRPAEAYYDKDLGEFLLPYAVAREAEDPDAVLLAFLQSTYEAAADLAAWDRASLEV